MAIFVGEGMTIVCAATNPATEEQISTAPAAVEFYVPGKNPQNVPADRTADKGPFAMVFDPDVVNKDGTKGAYIAAVDTGGWAAGKWTFKVTLTDSLESWEYATVTLKA